MVGLGIHRMWRGRLSLVGQGWGIIMIRQDILFSSFLTKKGIIRLIRIKEYPIEVEHMDIRFGDATGEFEYFEIKRGDMTEELGERLDLARAEMTKMTQKQDVMIEKLDNNTSILKGNISILKENTSILNGFKNETNENLSQLTNIMTKHDVDAQERIANLTMVTMEISGIKERLSRLESVIG